MEIIPAIDLRGGRCVRLFQGDYDRETVFSDDPVAMAHHWVEQGAQRIHVVDLDGARDGRPANEAAVRSIIDAVDLPVQVAGGIRDLAAIEGWLEAGADRVVLGTAAVRDPEFAAEAARRHGERVLVSIDARDGVVATDGWRQSTDVQAEELLRRLAALGVKRFAYTDIGRDGTLGSPNFEAVETMVAATDAPIIAAGGVAEVAHVVRLAELGAEGVIVGMALSDGRLRLPEALAAVR
ncbi:MAG: 1-(5-phosphoribosyl)-5-[(5-phosphoribosylamino)methylideneamino]imidazole-4-carboxamide isomerase [Chloroflexi bacterium]|nr:1-(5-phosphoribosyl)-5-[(5-phosphoribosylamino)methylideneamino]imidazole-4-carboxamide isomerase [Chloroflexota bacterium]